MEKREELYRGKAKSVFATDDPEHLVMLFRDDTSAFDGKKREQLERKGSVNNRFNAFVMEKLAVAGIPTHFVRLLDDRETLVKRLTMLPLECVVRNLAAGSLCRRYGIEEGRVLSPPTFEFFLKSDALGDPMVNEYHIDSLGWAETWQVARMKELTFRINDILTPLFLAGGMVLVDYKLEFGLINGELMLGDEVTPDGCRVWDRDTLEKLDKDRFRQDLGRVVESYELIGQRLGLTFG
ncbi:MAG: phosphoribosylaminoimidazolesuccinocarboxamide synthase [Gammaproteobacteria bacterium]|nr:phosphoribosylaminoimidazolesuccinocarboxamide synthase [Gammaproteobacteria bacterium]